ncbi:hypothetical protein Tco_0668097 [Tanacetum coccineum]
MRADELYKFSDGTLKKVRDELHHRILDFRLGYNDKMSRRKWMAIDKKRSELMVELIDKQMHERRIIKNLERLVGARELEMDYKLIMRTSENEHLKSKVVDFTTVQNLQLQVEELKSVNESLNLSVEELSKARALSEVTLRERDEMISAQCEKLRLLEEHSETFHEVQSEFDSEIVYDTHDNSEKDVILRESEFLEKSDQMKSQVSKLLKKLQISDQEMKQQIILFEEDKRMVLDKNEFLEKMSSSVQKEYYDLLASNDKEYESNISKISTTSSTFKTKNLELIKEMRDKVKCFDEETKMFETNISKLENVLAQRVKDFNDVKTELSRRTDKFET